MQLPLSPIEAQGECRAGTWMGGQVLTENVSVQSWRGGGNPWSTQRAPQKTSARARDGVPPSHRSAPHRYAMCASSRNVSDDLIHTFRLDKHNYEDCLKPPHYSARRGTFLTALRASRVGVKQNMSVRCFKRGVFTARCYALTSLVATALGGRVQITGYA